MDLPDFWDLDEVNVSVPFLVPTRCHWRNVVKKNGKEGKDYQTD